MEVSCQHHTPAALSTGKSPVPRRVLEALWTPWRRKNSLAPTGIRTLEHPTRNLVSILTMPSRHPAWISVYGSITLLSVPYIQKSDKSIVFVLYNNKTVGATPLCLAGEKPRRVRPRISTPRLKFSNSSNSLSMRELQAGSKYRAVGHVKKKFTLHQSVVSKGKTERPRFMNIAVELLSMKLTPVCLSAAILTQRIHLLVSQDITSRICYRTLK
jgi:hypothetical protein